MAITHKISFVVCIIGQFALSSWAHAQGQDFSKVEITSNDLGSGVHALFGAGGNLGVSVGEDGVFLIDDQFAPLTPKIKAAIAKLSDKPVKFLINTHWHFDHTGGNENLGKDGTIIVAHDNVRKLMSEDQAISFFNAQIPKAPKAALPIITFNDSSTFHLNGETMVVKHLPPGHTDGDSVVYFKNADVLHTGDLYFNGIYPFIDIEHGGTIDGMIANAGTILTMAGSKTQIIPGHGPLSNREEVAAFREMLQSIRNKVEAGIEAGKTLEEVVAAKPSAQFDSVWGNGFLKPDAFVTLVYNDLH